jgi:hypothetical protein
MFNLIMTLRFLTLLLLVAPHAPALAQECYDFPDNSQLSPSSFSPRKTAFFLGGGFGVRYGRYTLWSDYKGIKNNKQSISPNRWVRESLSVSCQAKPNGERAYFYFAVDAETGSFLTSPVAKYGQQPKPRDCR